MLKSRSGDGSKLASAALSTFREGDIVGTYAHDEIEFLLPDSPPNIAKAVVERMLETSGSEHSSVGLAVAPEDGDNAERLLRAARDALAKALAQGGGICRSGAIEFEATTPSPHSDASRHVMQEIQRTVAGRRAAPARRRARAAASATTRACTTRRARARTGPSC